MDDGRSFDVPRKGGLAPSYSTVADTPLSCADTLRRDVGHVVTLDKKHPSTE
ncbi:hypothetical protein B005_2130 [Nocardiopsis alba ATCC BAA-2165]|uniref:Uncharacterized protein n=1 Tax=Nocardiopsis alba (strain ATCC BAA-2165 / BE74) TaxID=1205910 RepID=J7LHT7_NOCAA|nr:hypothetical protein B005_2130 [Nocardiopsis alba ATCC BAA-2165]